MRDQTSAVANGEPTARPGLERSPAPRGRGWRPLTALLIFQAVLVGIPLVRGGWFADDLFNAAVVHGKPLNWTFMSRDFFGHFLPLAQVPLWIAGHLLLHHTTVVLAELVMLLTCSALLVEILFRLVGPRRLLVYSVALTYVTTPLTLPSVLWWASAFEQVPAHFCTLLAILFQLQWLRSRRPVVLAGLAVATAVGICFWDGVNLLIVWLPVLTLTVSSGSLTQRLRAVVSCWPAWIALLVPLILYQYLYSMSKHGSPTTPHLGMLLRLIGVAWAQGFVPGLAGGPLAWRYSGYGYFAVAAAPSWFVVASEIAFIWLVVATVRRSRQAWYAWGLVVAAILPALALVALGRLGLLGTAIGRDYRYLSLSTIPALLGVAVAVAKAWPVGSLSAGRMSLALRRQQGLGLAAVGVVAILGVISAVRYDVAWDKLPTDSYFSTIAADAGKLNTATRPITLINHNVPASIQVDYFGPGTARLSWILPPLGVPGLRYDGVADKPYWIDTDGHIKPAVLVTEAKLPAANGSCSHGGAAEMLRFSTTQQLPWVSEYVLHVRLLQTSASTVSVRMLKENKSIPSNYYDNKTVSVGAGAHDVVLYQNGTPFNGADVIIRARKPVCVSSAEITRLKQP